jgi:hypothetical protein
MFHNGIYNLEIAKYNLLKTVKFLAKNGKIYKRC